MDRLENFWNVISTYPAVVIIVLFIGIAIGAAVNIAKFAQILGSLHDLWYFAKNAKKKELERLGFSYSQADFIKAIKDGNTKHAMLFIQAGIEIESKDASGWTALFLAAQGDMLELVKELIKRGANVNFRNNGWTPFSNAVANGRLEIAKELEKEGADVNVSNNDGRTPIILAADYDRFEMFKYLLSLPAVKLDHRTQSGATIRDFLRDKSHFQTALEEELKKRSV